MSIKKLSDEIKSLFCSSNLTSYKNVIEELVYNSLDAKATSIAIRVHIEQNKIQVIDNGFGIPERDFQLLGERYATSKYVDITNFKLAPSTYGSRGQSLASIIEVSKDVKITSRCENDDVTLVKVYRQGRLIDLMKTTTRPSKGTTIEIYGFLYNLNIQHQSINKIQEITAIKTFLKQLSLVHNGVSLSLRDDSKNEVIFKMHKSKDMYQVLKLLFNVDKENIQELIVEKNEYKAFAFLGKSFDCSSYHWIFLNKRIVNINCKLHKIICNNFSKYLHPGLKKIISKNSANIEDYEEMKNCIPFYIIFFTCPYYDYDVNKVPKPSVEFNDWTKIEKVIEKLIKFYVGDIKLKEINVNNHENLNPIQTDTREQVRKIIQKILGNSSNKVGVSQMQNGVKGKLMKRKKKKSLNIIRSKVLTDRPNDLRNCYLEYKLTSKIRKINKQTSEKVKNKIITNKSQVDMTGNIELCKPPIETYKEYKKKKTQRKANLLDTWEKEEQGDTHTKPEIHETHKSIQRYDNTILFHGNENNHADFRKRTISLFNDKVLPAKKHNCKCIEYRKEYSKNLFYKSRDLLKTILGTQKIVTPKLSLLPSLQNIKYRHPSPPAKPNYDELHTTVTFQSHHYNNDVNKSDYVNNKITKSYRRANYNPSVEKFININKHKSDKKNNFISEQAKENFIVPKNSMLYTDIKNKIKLGYKCHRNDLKSKWSKYFDISNMSGYSIEDRKSVKSKKCYSVYGNDNNIRYRDREKNTESVKYTYTITSSNFTMNINSDTRPSSHITYNKSENFKSNLVTNNRNPRNIVFLSNFQNTSASTEEMIFPKTETNNINLFHKSNRTRLKNHKLKDYTCDLISAVTNNARKSHQMDFPSFEHSLSIKTKMNCPKGVQELIDIKDITNVDSKSSYDDQNTIENINPPNVCQIMMDERSKIINDDELSILNVSILPSLNNVDKENQVNGTNHDVSLILQNSCVECNQIEAKCDSGNRNVKEVVVDSERNKGTVLKSNYFSPETFHLKNRLRFIPKGMSPIFEKCKTKTTFDAIMETPYFEEDLYNDFINDVQANTEVYEAIVQKTKEATTRAIEKANNRLAKDNSSLTFSIDSFKEAAVYGQVDNKFIATLMKGKSDNMNYFVLFDQHAVHERITLEKNLSGYLNDNGWKSVELDDMWLKLPEDEILHLHNYKEKFEYFGLHWTIFNNREIKIHSIPAAILGQNSREVDKMIGAVRKLISEAIVNITSQKGCVSQYPKSIMNLVFSEACRNAIKFGDVLSQKDCADLISTLSTCNTPFQCAHGRPVMAIIMDFKSEYRKYQVINSYYQPMIPELHESY